LNVDQGTDKASLLDPALSLALSGFRGGGGLSVMRCAETSFAGHKGNPAAVAKKTGLDGAVV
jgi:hypothetical protein